MHDFKVTDGYLYCEGLRVADICREVETPFYLYSRRTITQHYLKLDAAFQDIPHLICFSLKSSSNIEIIRVLKELGSGADIVSGGELFRAFKAGVPPERIVYSGVGKTDEELQFAIKSGILMVNVESEQEAEILNDIAKALKTKVGVALRVNPDVDPHTHEKITTGKEENKFGIPLSDAERVYQKMRSMGYLQILGIDCHIGSQILSPEPYVESIEIVRSLLFSLKKGGIELRYLNIGGGLGIIYEDENPATADQFKKAIEHLVRDLNVILVIEPGRFIMGNAGILVTRVLFTKQSKKKRFVIVDAGMNDLIRPTLYDAYHAIQCVTPNSKALETVDVVGPICESGDFFAKDRALPKVERGDILAVMSAGAYGSSMASNYNSRPRAEEVLVYGSSFRIIRKRESYDDLIAKEIS